MADPSVPSPDDAPVYIEPLVCWKSWSIDRIESSPHRRTDPWAIKPWSVAQAQGTDQLTHSGPVGQFRLVTGVATHWPHRERLVAACRAGRDHRAPDPGCRCGIYAATSHSVLRERGYAAGPHDSHAPDVVGEVWMWGRIMQTDEIVRAEFAYPKRLFLPHRSWQWGKPLKEAYGIPVWLKNPFTMEVD